MTGSHVPYQPSVSYAVFHCGECMETSATVTSGPCRAYGGGKAAEAPSIRHAPRHAYNAFSLCQAFKETVISHCAGLPFFVCCTSSVSLFISGFICLSRFWALIFKHLCIRLRSYFTFRLVGLRCVGLTFNLAGFYITIWILLSTLTRSSF